MSTLPRNNEPRPARGNGAGVGLLAISAVLMLAGCMVGPDFAPPAAPAVQSFVPTDKAANQQEVWSGGGQTQQMSATEPLTRDWWSRFRSPGIDSAVAAALKDNPTLTGAKAALQRSEQVRLAGAGVFFPQIDLQAGATRELYSPLHVGQMEPSTIFNLFTLSSSVSYALDLWGGERRELEGLSADVDAQRQALASTYLMLTANVVNTMIARAAYCDELDATQTMIALLDQQIALTRVQVTAGATAYASVLALDAQRSSLAANLPALEQHIGQADDLLAQLAGQYPADWHTPDLSLDDISLPEHLPDVAPSSLVHRRPDILQAEAQLHSASAQVGVATAALFPNITLSASGGFGGNTTGTLFGSAGRAWSVGAGLTAPLFHGGALWYQRRAAQSAYEVADASYRQTVLAAFTQVADTLQALKNDAEALDLQTQALADAQQTLTLTRADYSAGVTGYLQLLTADTQYHQARIARLQAVAQRLQDTVALYVALGGGWEATGK